MIVNSNVRFCFFFLCCFCFLGTSHALVSIKVSDFEGVPVFNANVTLTNEINSETFNATTDSSGICKIDINTAVSDIKPQTFSLGQNYPNPFNPSTTIPFTLSHANETKLIIYNTLGQTICTLINQYLSAGTHAVIWNGHDANGAGVGAGVYIYRLIVGKESIARKMLIIDGNRSGASSVYHGGFSLHGQLFKPTRATFKVIITGSYIRPFETTGVVLIDDQMLEYNVIRPKINVTANPESGTTFTIGSEQLIDLKISHSGLPEGSEIHAHCWASIKESDRDYILLVDQDFKIPEENAPNDFYKVMQYIIIGSNNRNMAFITKIDSNQSENNGILQITIPRLTNTYNQVLIHITAFDSENRKVYVFDQYSQM